jgi:hypothetical protein
VRVCEREKQILKGRNRDLERQVQKDRQSERERERNRWREEELADTERNRLIVKERKRDNKQV